MTDLALETAADILDGLVCECGHVNGDHATDLWDGAKGKAGASLSSW